MILCIQLVFIPSQFHLADVNYLSQAIKIFSYPIMYATRGIYHYTHIQVTKHFKGSPTMPSFESLVKKWNRTYNILLPIISPFKIFNLSPFYCCLCGPLFSPKHPSLFYHLHHAIHTKAQHFNGTKLAQQS